MELNIKPKEPRRYIIKDTKENLYVYGNARYGNKLYHAHIFDYNEEIGFFRTDKDAEIIFLDEKKGLELLVGERKKLLEESYRREEELKKLKEGVEKLHQANKEMVDEYESECFRKYNEASGISPETKKEIIENIVNKK
jgi:hypothetical protein